MKTTKKIISALLACLLCLGIFTASAFAANYIGEAKAKEIALSKAGVSAEQAQFLTCQFDYDNGVAVYEVEFYFGRTEYSYDINAKTGAVIKAEIDKNETDIPDPNAEYIGKAKAKEIAFKAAGVNEADASRVKVKFDFDDGIAKYEVEFHANGFEYDYEINAISGSIVKAEKEKESGFSSLFFIEWIKRLIEVFKSFFGK